MIVPKAHYELDSANAADTRHSWVDAGLQKMSMEKLDFFFRCADELIFYPTVPRGVAMGYGISMISCSLYDIRNIEFYTNRVEKRFRFGFDCGADEDPNVGLCGSGAGFMFADVKLALMYLLAGWTEKNFVSAYMQTMAGIENHKLSFSHDLRNAKFVYHSFEEDERDGSPSEFKAWRDKLWGSGRDPSR